MQLYSTNNPSYTVGLKEAVMKGLAEDKGLFMPSRLPRLPEAFFQNIETHSLPALAEQICLALFEGAIPETEVRRIVREAINFPAPLVQLDEDTHILELTHGPSLAFKDFGARFMAQLMSYFNQGESKELLILVATSGDTGGAVAAGFHHAPGIKVVILYPSGKVSAIQEKQLTTLGGNITALEIDGTFDDCQALVKSAFLDPDLQQRLRLSSANSINIARLIPQSFYYVEAYKQLADKQRPVVFCVPSGNFGNLTAGLMAAQMGLPVAHFIAATNANDVVPHYLATGDYRPKPSVRTISNAMDVGNPSNFARMLDLYGSTWNNMASQISGYAFDDRATEEAVRRMAEEKGYIIDPHGAVGLLAVEQYRREKGKGDEQYIILETAHPAKFGEDMRRILGRDVPMPEALASLLDKEKKAVALGAAFETFKHFLLSHFA